MDIINSENDKIIISNENFLELKDLNENILLNNFHIEFDYEFYISYYNDLNNIKTLESALEHYNTIGKNNNFICNINELSINIFDYEIYTKLNTNLNKMNKREAVFHWINYGKDKKLFSNINDINNNIFDYEIYILYYNLNNLSKRDAILHWLNNKDTNIYNIININQISQDIFDYELYIKYHNDLNNYTKRDAILHWLNYGKNENRICKIDDIKDIYDDINYEINQSNIFFDYELYILYYNLKSMNKRSSFIHWIDNGKNIENIYNINKISNDIFDYDIYNIFNENNNNFENKTDAILYWLKNNRDKNIICNLECINNDIFDYELYINYYNLNINNLDNINKKKILLYWHENINININTTIKNSDKIFNINNYTDNILDYELYIKYYNDLNNYTKRDAILHWLNYGKNENRISKIEDINNDIFDYEFYILYYNLDKSLSKRDALFHMINNKDENKYITIENIPNNIFDYELYIKFNNLNNLLNKREAIFHYLESLNKDLNLLEAIGKTIFPEIYCIYNIENISNELFDYEIYTLYYNLNITNKREALLYWLDNGKDENLIINMNKINNDIFDDDLYVLFNNDINKIKNKRDRLIHFLKYGKNENRIYTIDNILNNFFEYEIYTLYYNLNNIIDKRTAIFHLLNTHINNEIILDNEINDQLNIWYILNKKNIIYNMQSLSKDIFDYTFYIKFNKDLNNLSEKDAVLHWLQNGRYENRISNINQISDSIFDYEIYSLYYNLNITNKRDLLFHWLDNGKDENLIINIDKISENIFNYELYTKFYNDINNFTKKDAFIHWLKYGKYENRICNINNINNNNNIFDYEFYILYYKDLSYIKNNYEAIFHWINYGKSENRICTINEINNDIFDYKLYITTSNDIKNLIYKRDAVFHWLKYRKNENRIYNLKSLQLNYNTAYNFNMYKYLINKKIINPNIVKTNFEELIKKNKNNNREFFISTFIKNFYNIFKINCNLEFNNYIIDKINNEYYLDIDQWKNILKNIIDNLSEKELYIYYNINLNNEFKYLLNYKIEKLNNNELILLYKKILKYNIDNLNNNQLKICQILNDIIKEYSEFSKLINSNKLSNIVNIKNTKYYINNIIKDNNLKNFITFIIPTIGRKSLLTTIKSLQNLKYEKWNAVIIFDGIKNNFIINDDRIKILEHEKIGDINEITSNAGLVRNIGLNYIDDSEYIAFLDDDDCIDPNYINYLIEEININKDIDICIFRMINENNLILPEKLDNKILKTKVGISFAININIAKNFKFTNSNFEDYLFLKKVQLYGGKIVISKYIGYFIRIEPYTIYEEFPRILIEDI